MSLGNPLAGIANRSLFAWNQPRVDTSNPGALARFIFRACLNAAFFCACVLFSRLRAEASFITAPTYPAGRPGHSIAVGDLNGDGIPDLVVVDSYNASDNRTVTILLGNGDGTFQFVQSYAAGNGTDYLVTLADFNGDGYLDIVVAGGRNLSVLLGNGDLTFQAAHNYAVPAIALVVGDFNGDGIPDLAVTYSTSRVSSVSILLGKGDGSFAAAEKYGAGQGTPGSVTTGDFNGDGHLDLAVTNYDDPGLVSILLGNGDGTSQAAQSYAVGHNSGPRSIAVGDFNGDGIADLAVTGNAYRAYILLGNGDGTFQAAQSYATGNAGGLVAVRDFNGDGKLDLAVGGAFGVCILLGNGDGTFHTTRSYAATFPAGGMVVGDFNGDGIPDIAVNNWNGYAFLGPSGTVSILLGKGDGTLHAAQTFAAGAYPSDVAVGDFNGDGIPDLAVANFFSGTVSILLGSGDGTFGAAQSYAVGSYPNALAVGNFNGDGHLDLAVAGGQSAGTLSILLGNGDGSFQAAHTFPAGEPPNFPAVGEISVAVGDFNRDGKQDLVTTNLYQEFRGPRVQREVRVFLGNGDGTFQAPKSYATDIAHHSMTVADFSGDGILDLAVVSESGVSVLLGNGDGTFQAAQSYLAGPGPVSLTAGDFNGDGMIDLAVANIDFFNGYQGTVSILRGNGDGTFQAPQSYVAGTWTGFVIVGDFNGDGFPDLAVTNGADLGMISVLLGNGDGTFQAPQFYAAGASPARVAVGDFNGDGYPDLAAANYVGDQGTVTILLNAADWGR